MNGLRSAGITVAVQIANEVFQRIENPCCQKCPEMRDIFIKTVVVDWPELAGATGSSNQATNIVLLMTWQNKNALQTST